jgi:hypothetical protein
MASQRKTSFFVLSPPLRTNILAKFVVYFILNEGRKTEMEYRLMSRCFVWDKVRD